MRDEYKAEVWQGGQRVATISGVSEDRVRHEGLHYAAMYGQDGCVDVRFFSRRKSGRWGFEGGNVFNLAKPTEGEG